MDARVDEREAVRRDASNSVFNGIAYHEASDRLLTERESEAQAKQRILEEKLAAMEAEEADFVKLSAWLIHDLQSGDTGMFDAEVPRR